MHRPHRLPVALLLSMAVLGGSTSSSTSSAPLKNVLLIVIDDLRPQLNAYGAPDMKMANGTSTTPHIDALAAEGALFERAYVQQAICSPTRNSFLSGRYPDKTKTWNFINSFRDEGVGDGWTALPEFFLKHGYWTTGAGKVYHPGHPPNYDGNRSWSDFSGFSKGGKCACGGKHTPWPPGGHATCEGVVSSCGDDQVVQIVSEQLAQAANGSIKSPWFIAAGLHKPHMPFFAKQEHFALYPKPSAPLPAHVPAGYPYDAWHSCLSDLGGKAGVNYSNWGQFVDISNSMSYERPMEAAPAAHLRRGYFASVTYTDENVGQIMSAAKGLGLLEDTVVALIGDHGWSLGEGNLWCKMTTGENGARVPLIIRAPWAQKGGRGLRVAALAEAVDLYKTLVELSGLGLAAVEAGVDGVSLARLLQAKAAPPPRTIAKSQFPRCWSAIARTQHLSALPALDRTDCQDINATDFDLMGYSVRSADYRYTEWRAWDGAKLVGRFDLPPNATELYDHRATPFLNAFGKELVNVVVDPKYASAAKEMAAQLRAAFPQTAAD